MMAAERRRSAVLPQDSVVGAALQAVAAWLRQMRLFVTLGELLSSSNGTSRETGETEVRDQEVRAGFIHFLTKCIPTARYLRCVLRLLLTWPWPVQPGVGHLRTFSCMARTERKNRIFVLKLLLWVLAARVQPGGFSRSSYSPGGSGPCADSLTGCGGEGKARSRGLFRHTPAWDT